MLKNIIGILLVLILVAVGYYAYSSHQENTAREKFKHSILAMPTQFKINQTVPPDVPMKTDVMVVYPKIYFYLDLTDIKDKKIPAEQMAELESRNNQLCQTFFDNLREMILRHGQEFDALQFLKLVKNENLQAEFNLRNAFGEVLYRQQAVLAQCPQYYSALKLLK